MAVDTPARLRALHALRLKSFVATEVIADLLASDVDAVEADLRALETDELVKYREGRMSGWMLTAEGRTSGEAQLAEELDAAGQRDTVDGAYRRFLELNGRMLAVCTRWQLRPGPDGEDAINDHEDAAYDADVIAELVSIDEGVQPICADLAGALSRFGRYSERLVESLDKVRAGEAEWFTKPTIDSYHTVWFELHEDLLATLGIDRATEGAH